MSTAGKKQNEKAGQSCRVVLPLDRCFWASGELLVGCQGTFGCVFVLDLKSMGNKKQLLCSWIRGLSGCNDLIHGILCHAEWMDEIHFAPFRNPGTLYGRRLTPVATSFRPKNKHPGMGIPQIPPPQWRQSAQEAANDPIVVLTAYACLQSSWWPV